MSQPHVQQIGAFDPIQAFSQTFTNVTAMFEGLDDDREALPPEEIIRAAVLSADLLETIGEYTVTSVLAILSRYVDPETYAQARQNYVETRQNRTPQETREYRLSLMQKVAQFIPHEVDLPKDGPAPD